MPILKLMQNITITKTVFRRLWWKQCDLYSKICHILNCWFKKKCVHGNTQNPMRVWSMCRIPLQKCTNRNIIIWHLWCSRIFQEGLYNKTLNTGKIRHRYRGIHNCYYETFRQRKDDNSKTCTFIENETAKDRKETLKKDRRK